MEDFLMAQSETARLALGLLLLMCVNIVLGSVHAIFDSVFDLNKFLRGMAKAAIVILCFIATYFVGYLNKDIMNLSVDQQSVDILDAIHVMILAGYYAYAKQVINKMAQLISPPSS